MKNRVWLLAGCFLILTFFPPAAVSGQGPYISAGLGMAFLSDADVTDSTAPGVQLSFESDAGFSGLLALGYRYTDNFRMETELFYQTNDYDKTVYNGADVNLSGDTSCLAGLINAYYDFANASGFTPFVTAGAGIAKVKTSEFNITGSGVSSTSDDDTVFAYQAGAGLSYAISPSLSIDCTYRYFATLDPEFDTAESEYASHNIYIGLRLSY